ncbi:30S ribosomal protein S4 [Patescibacteria group bacterium]|nr:30S ribosomal protein S4 [Patescibacteria group bacterium]MBU1931305.1 30S ribosomal protein S4 [Patescibacteria group bacterium]
MGRDIRAKCKRCRREGVKLFLKGDRCYSPKCPIERKGAVPPGQHAGRGRRRMSNYGIQLREKQKVKRIYGLRERQFYKYYLEAAKKKANIGLTLLQLLETRLDNVVFRAGLTPSRSVSRQLVSHGKVLVNGKKVTVPSYGMRADDVVNLSAKAMETGIIKEFLSKKDVIIPKWLKRQAAVAKLERLPEREEMDVDINESLIIEFYSR